MLRKERIKRTLRYNYYEGVIIPMIRLSYKQQKLVDFINNYRRYVELNPIKEFESKEALDG